MFDLNKVVAWSIDATASSIETLGKVSDAFDATRGASKVRLKTSGRFVPPPPPAHDAEPEARDGWGFADTAFVVNGRGHVEMTGSRYELAGQELPALLPWVQDTMKVEIDPGDIYEPEVDWQIPAPRLNDAFVTAVRGELSEEQLITDDHDRLRHGHGHTQAEIFALRYGRFGRIPDLVAYPTDEAQVRLLVEAAREHDVSVVPFGGGTNVTDALRCPENEARMIVSVDMRRMNRILWIDPTNMMACIQAGSVGRNLEAQLEEFGFTLGHDPDSIEFSTLGGWIATNASGMKKNKYGNIEDLVLDVQVVTADGTISRAGATPRESVGLDVRRMLFGSEGNLGIITSAVVKIFPKPQSQKYGSILFKTFEDGVSFMYELTRRNAQPASVRLVDNLQFQFSMALKPGSSGLKAAKSKLEKAFVTKLKGFDPNQMVACTLVFEGDVDQVAAQEAEVYRIATRHGGMKAGASNGARGYALTFGIAYIRDFVMRHHVLAESFETSVAWSDVHDLCRRVKERVYAEHEARGLPGVPFVTCRVTQVYPTGVAVYFYLATYFKGVDNPSQVYADLEEAARDEVLKAGGSLSHHHGIGKLRSHFLPRVMSKTAIAWNQQVKDAVDPTNVFGINNQRPNSNGHAQVTH